MQTVNLTTGDRQVVVECILSEAPQQTLLLSLTNGVSGIGPDALEGAVAALVDLTAGELAGYFVLGENGVWVLDYAALPEHSYRLEIDVPGYGSVRAEDTLPPAVNVSYRFPLDRLQDIDSTYFFHRVHSAHGILLYLNQKYILVNRYLMNLNQIHVEYYIYFDFDLKSKEQNLFFFHNL